LTLIDSHFLCVGGGGAVRELFFKSTKKERKKKEQPKPAGVPSLV